MIYLVLYATNNNSMQVCAYRLNSFQESELENVRTQMQVCYPFIDCMHKFNIHSFPSVRWVYIYLPKKKNVKRWVYVY